MADELGPNVPLPMFEVADAPVDSCIAELCGRPQSDGLFCDEHWSMLSSELLVQLAEATPGSTSWFDARMRAVCELARLERMPYRRTLFDGTTIDSGY